jgi:hypothetical protein
VTAIVPAGSVLGKRPFLITSLEEASDGEDDNEDDCIFVDNKTEVD